jgi:carboxylesterase
MSASNLVNPHLDGDAFFWEGGPVGALLVHGFTATTAEVRPLGKALHQHGYTVAGPLLPGHGDTPEDCNRYRWQDWLDAVEESYKRLTLRCEQVFVGGESTGGLLALCLAAEHPQVAGILVYAPALRLRSRLSSILLPLLAPFIAVQHKRPHVRCPADDLWQGYAVYPLRAAAQLLALQRAARRRLSAIRRPILIVQGRLDHTVDPAVPNIICRSVHSTVKEVHWMENSAHCVALDAERERVAEVTLQFMGRVAR